jgi:PTS system beta-glucosides-specific IIC component
MNYKEAGSIILKLVGGKGNVSNLTHCLTRLRFNLIDSSKADTDALEALDYVLGTVKNEKDFQVIIGTDVENFYRPIQILVSEENPAPQKGGKGNLVDVFIDTVSGIFTPILPPLTAAGMLQALLALLIAFKVVSNTSQTYQILAFMGNTTFYFLPVLLASSAAKKFGCNSYIAMMLGALLIHPNFIKMVAASIETGEAIRFAGIPVYSATYTSSVIPIILGVWLMSKVEPIADRVSPKAIKFFTKPLITILVTGLVTLIVLGPIGYIASTWISDGVKYLDSLAGWLVPTLIGGALPLLVMTGIHHGLTAVGINNRMTIGYDSMIYPGQLASNVAQGAAGFAVSIKAKNSQIKQMAAATSFTAMCGITEPILFGVTMKIKTNLIATMIGGAISGFIFGTFGVKNFSGGAPGVLTLPSYIGLDAPMSNFYMAMAGTAIGAIASFIVAYILYKDPVDESIKTLSSPVEMTENETLYAPAAGKVVLLSEVNDPTFSSGLLGKGIAVVPDEGKVYAPADGTILSVFPTKHAVTMKTDKGAEVIIHIGLDTVKLNGEHFEVCINDGDKVKKGDLLVKFDLLEIKKEGYDTIIPLIITNSHAYQAVQVEVGQKKINNEILTLNI